MPAFFFACIDAVGPGPARGIGTRPMGLPACQVEHVRNRTAGHCGFPSHSTGVHANDHSHADIRDFSKDALHCAPHPAGIGVGRCLDAASSSGCSSGQGDCANEATDAERERCTSDQGVTWSSVLATKVELGDDAVAGARATLPSAIQQGRTAYFRRALIRRTTRLRSDPVRRSWVEDRWLWAGARACSGPQPPR